MPTKKTETKEPPVKLGAVCQYKKQESYYSSHSSSNITVYCKVVVIVDDKFCVITKIADSRGNLLNTEAPQILTMNKLTPVEDVSAIADKVIAPLTAELETHRKVISKLMATIKKTREGLNL